MDTAADRAASGIRALIVSGEYGPGDRLPSERDLAKDLALSRPALREGIRRLRSGGVLESRRGSGTYVAPVDLEGVFDVRVRLEPLGAERAAQLRTEAEAAGLRDAVDVMRSRLDDPAAFDTADAVFHGLVARASRSPVLISALDMLTEMALLSRAVTSGVEHLRNGSLTDVERICLAIERRHPKRAANAMERHIINVRADYVGVIDQDSARAVVVAKS